MIYLGKKTFDASFNRFAKNYHDIRPGYPEEMFVDIIKSTNLGAAARMIEIGTGTGIATRRLAETGCVITGVEPGENLMAIARENLAGFKNVTLENIMFEHFRPTDLYDMVFSATAFHWLEPESKFAKTKELLKSSGHLVLVWNSFGQSDAPAAKAVDEAYRRIMGGGESDPGMKTLEKIKEREKEILENGNFFFVSIRRYVVEHEFNPENYVALLHTFPKIINSDPQTRSALFSEVKDAILRNGGHIIIPVLTSLYICRKSEDFNNFLNQKYTI